MRRKARNFNVQLDVPDDAEIEDVVDYLEDAAKSWRGSLRPPGAHGDDDPGDPMWDLNTETVKVRPALKVRVADMPKLLPARNWEDRCG